LAALLTAVVVEQCLVDADGKRVALRLGSVHRLGP
jgi:hypothetical protein